jgi:hypothetical protein
MTDDSPEIRGPAPSAEGDSEHQVGGDEHEEDLLDEENEDAAVDEGTWRPVGQDEILSPGCSVRMNQETGQREVLEPSEVLEPIHTPSGNGRGTQQAEAEPVGKPKDLLTNN